jgi:hypothetical protein
VYFYDDGVVQLDSDVRLAFLSLAAGHYSLCSPPGPIHVPILAMAVF